MSVTFSGGISEFKVSNSFTKRLDRDLDRLIRQAIRAWIRTLFFNVEQWSGETRGSIKFAEGSNGNLGRFLNVQLPINAPFPRPNKNQFTGGPKGHYQFTSTKGLVYSFEYRSDVIQYFLNEFFANVSPSSPWHSVEKAGETFNRYIKENFERFSQSLSEMLVQSGSQEFTLSQ